EEIAEGLERVGLLQPPPRHERRPQVEVAGAGPSGCVEEYADQGAGALRPVQLRRHLRALQQGQQVQGGDVEAAVVAVGVHGEVVDASGEQRVQDVLVDGLDLDRGGRRHVVRDGRLGVLRAVDAGRVAQDHRQGAHLGRGELAGLVAAVGEAHGAALKDVGGDVVVGAVVVAVPGPVDGDGVPGGQGGGDVEVVEVGVAAGRRGARHEGRAVREQLHAEVVLAGPGG